MPRLVSFPLAELSGGWAVEPNPDGGSFVDVWWIVKPNHRRLGWLIVSLMTMALDRDVPTIIASMEADAMGHTPPQQAHRVSLAYC